jgi:hypothetical protein
MTADLGSASDSEGGGQQTSPDMAALTRIVEILEPLSDVNRQRTVAAALTLLGVQCDGVGDFLGKSSSSGHRGSQGELPRRAQTWISQNQLTVSALEEAFHFSAGNVQLIVNCLPGSTNKERTKQCYLLAGVRALLQAGVPVFTDNEARQLCRDFGCLDQANHAAYLKAVKNLLSGSKTTKYELTQPGLREAADLLRAVTSHAGS